MELGKEEERGEKMTIMANPMDAGDGDSMPIRRRRRRRLTDAECSPEEQRARKKARQRRRYLDIQWRVLKELHKVRIVRRSELLRAVRCSAAELEPVLDELLVNRQIAEGHRGRTTYYRLTENEAEDGALSGPAAFGFTP